MELTMIRQYTRKSNLRVQLEGYFEDTVTRELVKILQPDDSYDFTHSPDLMTNTEVAAHLAKANFTTNTTTTSLLT